MGKPFLIARATDKYLTPVNRIETIDNILKNYSVLWGQDVLFSSGRAAPNSYSVSTNEVDLKNKMNKLLDIFASGDKKGMAKKLFDQFLRKNSSITMYSNNDLDNAASNHSNIKDFMDLSLAAPNTEGTDPKKIRIHQALKNATWDITKVKVIDDLGVPAFNKGSKVWRTDDFDNGLGVMINGIQYVFIFVDKYKYDDEKHQYDITLSFSFFDVFGLDDDDLQEFGAKSDSFGTSDAKIGITAWWQLQHQFNYAPVITRANVSKSFTVSTKE